jgi:putative lipoprotein
MTMRAFFAAAALLAMAGAALSEAGVIRGSATTGGQIELKAGTVLEVELLDVSSGDAFGERRGSVSVPVRRLGPIPFVLSYDPAAIEAGNRYAVAARLLQGGQVIMRSESATPVLTGGAGNTAEIALVALAEPEAVAVDAAAGLVGSWTLSGAGGEGAVAGGVSSTLTLTEAGEALGSGGCNNFRASYSLEGGGVRFGPIAATKRLCPPPQMEQETRFFAALEATRGARVEDGTLLLLDAAGATILELAR